MRTGRAQILYKHSVTHANDLTEFLKLTHERKGKINQLWQQGEEAGEIVLQGEIVLRSGK